MVGVIINLAAVIFTCDFDGVDVSAHPIVSNWCDNKSACAWINSRCKHSLIGRELGKFFIGLLMSTKIGIHAEWLPTELNKIADDISRVKERDGNYDYSHLLRDHPSLRQCRLFEPSDSLLSLICAILRGKDSPDPRTLSKIEPRTLGSITSFGS